MVEVISHRLNNTVAERQADWASTKGTYRFWSNKSVDPQSLVGYHFSKVESLLSSSEPLKRVLQICDYTELDYTGSRSADSLGPLSYIKQRGMHLYNSMIVNSLGCPLGLLKQSYHIRSDADFGTSKAQCNHRSLEEKESYHWVEHFRRGQELAERYNNLEVVFVADREADFMELFTQRTAPKMHFVVRSHYDRKLSDGINNLVPTVDSWSIQGRYEAQVIHSKTRKMRKAQLDVRFGCAQVKLSCPLPQKKNLPAVRLFIVDVREMNNSGIDKDESIHWRLLTTLAVESFQDARLVIQYYIWRWLIERFHFLIKTGGTHAEKLQLQTPHRLKNAITTFSIAAMDAFKLRYLAENSPNESIYSIGISQIEHKVLYTYLHKKLKLTSAFDPLNPPTVKEYCIALGKIGGFFPSKRQPIPGLIILTRAREKLDTLVDAYLAFQ